MSQEKGGGEMLPVPVLLAILEKYNKEENKVTIRDNGLVILNQSGGGILIFDSSTRI
jgi:hypothetical protein